MSKGQFFLPRNLQKSGKCKNRHCKGALLKKIDVGMVCPQCAVVYDESLILHSDYKTMKQSEKNISNNGKIASEKIIIPRDLSGKQKKEFLRTYWAVETHTEPLHRKRSRRVLKKAVEVIRLLPSIYRSEYYTKTLEIIVKKIIDQCYDTWVFVRNPSGLGVYENCICPEFTGQGGFSLPKDINVIIGASIIYGSNFVLGLKGGVLVDEVVSTINVGEASKKLANQISKFLNTLKRKKVISDIALNQAAPKGVENDKYKNSLQFFCNSQGFPQYLLKQITDLLVKCNKGVWLSGRHPKNCLSACILHIIWGDCGKYKSFKKEGRLFTIREIRIQYPKDKLIRDIMNFFHVKQKMLVQCERRIALCHKCAYG